MRFDLLIFDFDGTLADTLPICISSLQRALELHTGREFSEAEIVSHFGLSEDGIIQRLAPERWEHCLEDFLRIYADAHQNLTSSPAVEELLKELRSVGIQLALVTGKGAGTAEISLGHLGLGRYFERIEVGSPERNVKSDKIREILKDTGADPGRTGYVGDSPSDMVSAREGGVLPIGAAWLESADATALQAHSPAAVFTALEEFRRWALS